MYPQQQQIRQKRLIKLGIVLAVLVAVVFFLSSYSFVNLKNINNTDLTVSITPINQDGAEPKVYELKGSSKILLLKKSSYRIEVDEPKQNALYYKDVGGLLFDSQDLETAPQLKSLSLGDGTFECSSYDQTSGQALYYPCREYAGSLELRRPGELVALVDPLIETLADHSHIDGEAGAEEETTTMALKPYGNGFLVLASSDNKLSAETLNLQGTVTGTRTLQPPSDDIVVSDELFATATNPTVEHFAIMSTSQKKIYFYKNASTAAPEIIDVSSELNDVPSLQSVQLFIDKDTVYLVVTRELEQLESHDDTGEEITELDEEIEKAGNNQKVITVSIADKSIQEVGVSDDLIIRKITSGGNGGIILVPIISNEKPILITPSSETREINLMASEVNFLCWLNEDTLFFTPSGNDRLYRYSIDKKGAFMAYQTDGENIANLNCSHGKVSFTVESPRRGLTGQLAHYLLSDDTFEGGIRLDTVLPLSHTFSGDSYRVEQLGEGVLVNLEYDSNGNGPSPKETIQNEINAILLEQGVETKNIRYQYSF